MGRPVGEGLIPVMLGWPFAWCWMTVQSPAVYDIVWKVVHGSGGWHGRMVLHRTGCDAALASEGLSMALEAA